MQNLIILAAEETEGGHAPENPLGFVPVEFGASLVVFGLLLFAIWKFVVPRFEETFAERTEAIEGGLNAAETKQAEADARLAELEKQLADARHEAARIREEAREQGAQIVAEMREQAQALAGRIVGESLDDEARQSRVVERFLADLEADGSTRTGSGVN